MDQEQEFRNALIEYLRSAEMVRMDKAWKLEIGIEYDYVCGMKVFTKEEDKAPYHLVTPTTNWRSFLEKMNVLFQSKINRKLIQLTLAKTVCQLTEFPFTDELLASYSNEVLRQIWRHYELSVEALIPLYGIEIDGEVEIPLANTLLCSGHENSTLMQKASYEDTLEFLRKNIHEIRENDFLRVQVSGDDESRLRQADIETEKALSVLRFVVMWQSKYAGNNRVRTNPASAVNAFEHGGRFLLYHQPEEMTKPPAFHSEGARLFFFSERKIDIAYNSYGLENINYHYANPDYPISRRIVRALELYDSGVQALSNWQSLYRYVVSINIILPMSQGKREEITRLLTMLIQYGGNYIGSMRKEDTEDPESVTWDDLVKLTAEPFKDFYTLRGKILHGNLPIEELPDEQTEEARELAHNAIRLMALLAKEFNWQTDKDREKWFNSPQTPAIVLASNDEG